MSRPGQPVTPREARTYLRRLEHRKKVTLLFKNPGRNGHWWTTEPLLRVHLRELHDRPQRVLTEVRGYQSHVRKQIEGVREELGAEIDDLRSLVTMLQRRIEGRG